MYVIRVVSYKAQSDVLSYYGHVNLYYYLWSLLPNYLGNSSVTDKYNCLPTNLHHPWPQEDTSLLNWSRIEMARP
ncbi:hypothetical protein RJT34_05361 [Clitoria ternatea]|uniref:Uncharacterized protein n=1 Tax=Clitoria ternatea TaxID=43366 RepID=A0AAN9K321_CLITE